MHTRALQAAAEWPLSEAAAARHQQLAELHAEECAREERRREKREQMQVQGSVALR